MIVLEVCHHVLEAYDFCTLAQLIYTLICVIIGDRLFD